MRHIELSACNRRRTSTAARILTCAALLLAAAAAPAQAGWLDSEAPAVSEEAATTEELSLIGAWRVSVLTPENVPSGFEAYHVFHQGGTMTETSNLLATLVEGPGSGTWAQLEDGTYRATFQLYGFNEDGSPAGIIRVRMEVTLDGERKFVGNARAELFANNGDYLDFGISPLVGHRLRNLPLE